MGASYGQLAHSYQDLSSICIEMNLGALWYLTAAFQPWKQSFTHCLAQTGMAGPNLQTSGFVSRSKVHHQRGPFYTSFKIQSNSADKRQTSVTCEYSITAINVNSIYSQRAERNVCKGMLAEKQFHITDMVGCVYTVHKKRHESWCCIHRLISSDFELTSCFVCNFYTLEMELLTVSLIPWNW